MLIRVSSVRPARKQRLLGRQFPIISETQSHNSIKLTCAARCLHRWVDAGKFLTGFSAIGSLAIPAILAHSGTISTGALIMELAAALVLGSALIVYDYYSSQDNYYT